MNLLDLARGALTDRAASEGEPKRAVTAANRAEATADPATKRRRTKALALLAAKPGRRIAIIAEDDDPACVAVAIRGVAVGELEIAKDRYDAFTLLALLDDHARAPC